MDMALAQTTLPPQTQFTRDRQVRFLEALSVWGNVRAACRSACVSPQSAYRMRRASGGFALAWDAALLAARAQVEAVLADRALNGVSEAVFYHGEEVARRQRFDTRLLLAHLARLDAKAADPVLAEAAQDFDGVLERVAEGRAGVLGAPAGDAGDAPEEQSGEGIVEAALRYLEERAAEADAGD